MRTFLPLLAVVCLTSAAPSWPPTYTVQGVITIPFAEIQEPFAAYFDERLQRSRVDYYGGMDATYQRADEGEFGVLYKVVPEANNRLDSQERCFKAAGAKDAPVTVQSVLPDLSGFEKLGRDIKNGQDCEKWQREEVVGEKVNKYTVWLRIVHSTLDPDLSVAVPIHYEMKGYNNLLGSHYDHYFVNYEKFSPDAPDSKVFDAYKKFGPCGGMPGPGIDVDAAKHHNRVLLMNPVTELVDNVSHHVDAAFEEFKQLFGKAYNSIKHHDVRKDIFRQNLRYIHSHNRKHESFSLSSNHMADWTTEEMRMVRGRRYTPGYNGGKPFVYAKHEARDTPSEMDWRLYGAVSPVKDQSMCGSCWSFGTVGTLEGAMFLKTGKLTRLSEQALVDCSWQYGNNGCDGGEDFRVYKFMMENEGIPTDDAYGPYLGQNGICHVKDVKEAFQIKGFVNVTSGDNDALKVAIARHGPISVGIDASHRSLSFYSNGVYYEPKCDNSPDGLDHAVLAVGYGELDGDKYWLVKNSWSTYWGNDGYVLMSQKDNNCGVATSATYVIPE